MNETTENFWQVWNNLEPWQPPEVFWRLYYDEQGSPMFYSMEDLPGNYIDVTPEQYSLSSMQVRVVNGKLQQLSNKQTKKLMPSSTGTPCYPNNVAIVVDADSEHQCWRMKYNETN